ncbi:MAG: CDP-alcohol phosphatidyltransferase family protein [Planctomycetes bacterium]|nr:CDP-alcohol phosphatidyltransferase family protein [Planctomycetota bacterium]
MNPTIALVIPTSISSVRIAIGLAFLWIPPDWRIAAVALAAFTDLVDGPISRWLQADGTFGQVFDPIADKMCLAGILAAQMHEESLAWWEAALIGARDLLVTFAGLALLFRRGRSVWTQMPARWLGKATTALQAAFVLTLLLDSALARWLLVPTSLIGVLAFADYAIAFRSASHAENGSG